MLSTVSYACLVIFLDLPHVHEDLLSSTERDLPPSIEDIFSKVDVNQVFGMDDTLSNYADQKKTKGNFQ